MVNSSGSTVQLLPTTSSNSSTHLDDDVVAAPDESGRSGRNTSIHSAEDNLGLDGSIDYVDSDLEVPKSKSKSKKNENNVLTTDDASTKSKKSRRAKTMENFEYETFEGDDGDNDKDWNGTKTRKSAKKAAPKKQPASKRSKTSIAYAMEMLGDDENDDDYSPIGGSRKGKRKSAEVDSTVGRKKKTRSNTDDWELMPALPKGRKSSVLKQLAEGFDFDRDVGKAVVDTIEITSSDTSPTPQKDIVSPFKVDLSRASLFLPDEEKEKYDVFSPQTASPNTAELGQEILSQSSAVNLPLLSSSLQGPLNLHATESGAYMSSTIPDEDYFVSKAQAEEGEDSKTIEISSTISKVNTKSRLSRSKTLADMLVDIEGSEEEGDEHKQITMPKPEETPSESPATKRARMKQTRGKTSITLSPIQSHPRPDKPNPNGDSAPGSPLNVVRKRKMTSRVVAASDEESSLSELDEAAIRSPRRPISGVSRLEKQKKKVVQEERDNEGSPVTSTITVTTNVINQPSEAPKTGKRKTSARKPSNISVYENEDTHEVDFAVVVDEVGETVTKKPPAKRRKLSTMKKADNSDAADDKSLESRQASALVVNIDDDDDDDVTSDGEVKKKAAVKGKREARRKVTTTKEPKKLRKNTQNEILVEFLEAIMPMSNENEDGDDSDADIKNKSKLNKRNGPNRSVSLEFQDDVKGEGDADAHSTSSPPPPIQSKSEESRVDNTAQQQHISEPQTPKKNDAKVKKSPHSPINGGKPPSMRFRVGLSRRVNIEPLHGYLKK